MRQRVTSILLASILILTLCACGNSAAKWQEQYDLGMRYLSDGNYEEAIIAFEAAIKIDPKNADAYMQAAYAYIEMGDYDAAMEVLRRGYQKTGDETLKDKLESLEAGNYTLLNAYGATEFTCRKNFREFSTLDEYLQERIKMAVSAALEGDRDALMAMAAVGGFDPDYSPGHFQVDGGYVVEKVLTVWNDYKIEIYDPGEWYNGSDPYKFFTIEIRPQNGMGAYVWMKRDRVGDTTNSDSWLDYNDEIRIVSCPCVDWQWNGDVTENRYEEYVYRDADGASCHEVVTATERGTMRDGVWEGTSIETIHRISDWSNSIVEEDSDSTVERNRVFQNGVLIETDGKPFENGGCCLIDGDVYQTSFDGIPPIDKRYW